MCNRKNVTVNVTQHCGIYVTIIMRANDCTESEKSVILENAKKYYEIACSYNGEKYELPVYTPISDGEVVFNTTFAFPDEKMTQKYVEAISAV